MSLIEVRNVSKVYAVGGRRVTALEGVTLSINEGDFVAVMGPSGSGKSTLLSILGVLNPPTSGEVVVDGINVYALPVERRADFRSGYIGFAFQQFHLVPFLTVVENVMLPLAILKDSGRSQLAKARAVLEKVGLGEKLHRLPGQLSGGEQARVAIARAIVNHPPIVLADEPTGALDSQAGEEVMRLFRALNQEGMTIIMVTHNAENLKYVRRVVYMRDGRLIQPGSAAGSVGPEKKFGLGG